MIALMHWGDQLLAEPEGAADADPSTRASAAGEIDDRRICMKCGKQLNVRDACADRRAGRAERRSRSLEAAA